MRNPFKNLFKWRKDPSPPAAKVPEALRLATASVLKEVRCGVGGVDLKRGTRHFRGGAKVYIIDNYPGTCESVIVIGHERHSGRYVQLALKVWRLEDFRITTVYSPKVVQMVHEYYDSRLLPLDLERAEYLCNASREWVEWEVRRKATGKAKRNAGADALPPSSQL